MHVDLGNNDLSSRLRRLGDTGGEAPYDWAEFQRRRHAPAQFKRRRAVLAASVLFVASAAVALGYYIRSSAILHEVAPRDEQADLASSRCAAGAAPGASDGPRCAGAALAGPRAELGGGAVQRWLATLPREPVVRRVGTQAAETGLVDQIATLDQLLSAERVSGARPERLAVLEHQRAQLVGSLAQFRYAELLAAASH